MASRLRNQPGVAAGAFLSLLTTLVGTEASAQQPRQQAALQGASTASTTTNISFNATPLPPKVVNSNLTIEVAYPQPSKTTFYPVDQCNGNMGGHPVSLIGSWRWQAYYDRSLCYLSVANCWSHGNYLVQVAHTYTPGYTEGVPLECWTPEQLQTKGPEALAVWTAGAATAAGLQQHP